MKREMFHPYKAFLLRCIKSCETTKQVEICSHMVNHFHDIFLRVVSQDEITASSDELLEALQNQHDSLL
jgi:hypothetical protein